MIKLFLLCLLILYHVYFFVSFKKLEAKPDSTPTDPKPYQVHISKINQNGFRFAVNNTVVWEHNIPKDKYKFRNGTFDVVRRDDCEYAPEGKLIPATGQPLYDFLKTNPDLQRQLAFKQGRHSPYVVPEKGAFYFKCLNNQINSVGICPSGQIFHKKECIDINRCTGKPDDTKIPDSSSIHHYIKCYHGKEIRKYCGPKQFFIHDRCVSKDDTSYYCQFNDKPLKLDQVTKMECDNGKPIFTTCPPGTKFFEDEPTVCESTVCVNQLNGTKIKLPDITVGPFNFSPGYNVCLGEKVAQTIECPRVWDDQQSKGDNLTHLPMVFDGQQCSVPSFCENVFSKDPNVLVPAHNFTKHVKNWQFSETFDRLNGYQCYNDKKIWRELHPGTHIDEHYHLADSCVSAPNASLPIPGKLNEYYDCNLRQKALCPQSQHFNGKECIKTPKNAFTYNAIPIFKFGQLNFESWITPWDNKTQSTAKCNPSDIYLKLYDVCSDPDCAKYDFLSMIPDFGLLIPPTKDGKFKCKFNVADRTIRKEPVSYNYRFWDQKILRQQEDKDKNCVEGSNIQTGNFIWDKTIYMTCKEKQPFVFCPSVHTTNITETEKHTFTCDNRNSNMIQFYSPNPVKFSDNEIITIKPPENTKGVRFKIDNGPWKELKEKGYHFSKTKNGRQFTLQVDKPVYMELGHRVNHPPNVAIKYSGDKMQAYEGGLRSGYLMKNDIFTTDTLNFPTYTPNTYVDSLTEQHL